LYGIKHENLSTRVCEREREGVGDACLREREGVGDACLREREGVGGRVFARERVSATLVCERGCRFAREGVGVGGERVSAQTKSIKQIHILKNRKYIY
jgi:hypothetical protein